MCFVDVDVFYMCVFNNISEVKIESNMFGGNAGEP